MQATTGISNTRAISNHIRNSFATKTGEGSNRPALQSTSKVATAPHLQNIVDAPFSLPAVNLVQQPHRRHRVIAVGAPQHSRVVEIRRLLTSHIAERNEEDGESG